ncbi:MAG TPA: aminopeptidase [Gemmatimonadaceae bacterium]|nr:aminopeptidase [Gemmatimonadaceae bacterium]
MTRPRWWRRRWAKVASAILGVLLALLVALPVGRYLLRAGWEEARILASRRDIDDVIADPATDERTRAKLRLVLAARAFAADSMKLRAKHSFTTYTRLRRDTLVLVLSGAYRDRLKRYTWWFPVVGRVPYKGFFDFDAARRAEREMSDDGFDASLRPASAFSTLGFFNDPLLSTTLRTDSLELANTVIHELTHNTFYLPGQAVFNESFANFVGSRGAAWLFRTRGSARAVEQTNDRWSDERLLAGFWESLYASIDSAFDARPGEEADAVHARLVARDSIYAAARHRLVETLGPKLRTIGPRYLERVPLNNAALLAHRVYLTDLDLFDAVYARERWNLPATVQRIIALAKEDPKNPYGALRRWLGVPEGAATAAAGG